MEQRVLPGKPYDLSREPLLSLTVSHPNCVQAYRLQLLCVKADSEEGEEGGAAAKRAETWGPVGSIPLGGPPSGSSGSGGAHSSGGRGHEAAAAAPEAAGAPVSAGRSTGDGLGATSSFGRGRRADSKGGSGPAAPPLEQWASVEDVGSASSSHGVLAPGCGGGGRRAGTSGLQLPRWVLGRCCLARDDRAPNTLPTTSCTASLCLAMPPQALGNLAADGVLRQRSAQRSAGGTASAIRNYQ